MKERPILFSSAMVRAILDGRKTQTRRVITTREALQFIGGRGEEADPDRWGWAFDGPCQHGYMVLGRGHNQRCDHGLVSIPCPHGEPGDQLWVRETWCLASDEAAHEELSAETWRPRGPKTYGDSDVHHVAFYRATDGDVINIQDEERSPWKPSIFMPRWASRITLEIAEVRVQRLQEISEDDARAEGVEPVMWERKVYPSGRAATVETPSYRDGFGVLWDKINSKRCPWASNPWVWCLTFRRLP